MAEPRQCGCRYTTISRKNRFIGFAGLFAIGCFFSAVSTLGIPMILLAPSKFAVPYTLGSLCSIGSTMCLVGPSKQLKNMFAESRRISTAAYLVSVVLTLLFAFKGQVLLCLVAIVVQLVAMVWYVASYIPGGQMMVKGCGKKCIACCSR